MSNIAENIIVTYFMGYPIVYFGFNYIMETLKMPQYTIPGFWFGMLCLLIFMIVKNTIFPKRIK